MQTAYAIVLEPLMKKLQNAESDDNYNETMEEFDKANGDEYDGVKYGNNNYKNLWSRILTPLGMNILTNRAFSRTANISISHLIQDPKLNKHKNYINIMLPRVILNRSSRGLKNSNSKGKKIHLRN